MAITNRNINISIKTTSQLKALIQTRHNLDELKRAGVNVDKQIKAIDTGLDRAGITATQAAKSFKQFRFQGLNMLFFGFFLERTFNRILDAGVSTFRKITEQGMGFGSALTALSAESEFLKFSLGEALNSVLEPLLPIIVDLVTAIANFIQEHPEVAFVAIGAAIAGVSLMVLGQLLTFFQNIGGFKMSGDFKDFIGPGGGLEKLGKFAAAGIGFALVFRGVMDLTEENILKGLSEAIAGGALLGIVAGKVTTKSGIALLTISTALAVGDVLWKDGFDIPAIYAALKAQGVNFLVAGAALGSPWLIGIGATLIVGDIAWNVGAKLGQMAADAAIGLLGRKGAQTIFNPFGGPLAALAGIPHFQSGGIMPQTGLAMLHAGERITPANQTSNSFGNINVTVNGGGITDERRLAQLISQAIANQIKNVTIPTSRFG